MIPSPEPLATISGFGLAELLDELAAAISFRLFGSETLAVAKPPVERLVADT